MDEGICEADSYIHISQAHIFWQRHYPETNRETTKQWKDEAKYEAKQRKDGTKVRKSAAKVQKCQAKQRGCFLLSPRRFVLSFPLQQLSPLNIVLIKKHAYISAVKLFCGNMCLFPEMQVFWNMHQIDMKSGLVLPLGSTWRIVYLLLIEVIWWSRFEESSARLSACWFSVPSHFMSDFYGRNLYNKWK